MAGGLAGKQVGVGVQRSGVRKEIVSVVDATVSQAQSISAPGLGQYLIYLRIEMDVAAHINGHRLQEADDLSGSACWVMSAPLSI